MVDMYQVVLGGIAVAIMVLVPILCVVGYDLLAGRWDASIERWKISRLTTGAGFVRCAISTVSRSSSSQLICGDCVPLSAETPIGPPPTRSAIVSPTTGC